MRRGTTVYTDPEKGIEILVSKVAEKHLGPEGVELFVGGLKIFMYYIEADRAYVSKQGSGLAISLIWSCNREVRRT